VAAVGVEAPASLEVLQRSACDTAQGYLFSKALTSVDMERWLTEWPQRAAKAWPGALAGG
jgi:EAL domain-containing protein (putative c-di-GMP-specific phosphodiesterase class I)